MMKNYVSSCDAWNSFINEQMEQSHMINLMQFLKEESFRKVVVPEKMDMFKPFKLTPFGRVRVVMFADEPYHSINVADGLAFSCKGEISKTLSCIYREIKNDVYPQNHNGSMAKLFDTGDLSNWARQGVLLINRRMTVTQKEPESHLGKGWEEFMVALIKMLNKTPGPIAFILLGNRSQKVSTSIDTRHTILEAPLPKEVGFEKSGIFSKCNKFTMTKYSKPIVWANYKSMYQY